MGNEFSVKSVVQMQEFGRWLGERLHAGDVVILAGDLGAGKTTLTQGIARGMGITEPITSPTFVIAREHQGPRVGLVHADAYRLGSVMELDDLALDWESQVCVVEWGGGLVEFLANDPLTIEISVAAGDSDTHQRSIHVHGSGSRWSPLIDQMRGEPWVS